MMPRSKVPEICDVSSLGLVGSLLTAGNLLPHGNLFQATPYLSLIGWIRVTYCRESSSIPAPELSAQRHGVFHWVIPESQLSGVLARR
jgi:hypothetical protein